MNSLTPNIFNQLQNNQDAHFKKLETNKNEFKMKEWSINIISIGPILNDLAPEVLMYDKY